MTTARSVAPDTGAAIREAGRKAARAHVSGDAATVRHWRTWADQHIGLTPNLDRATVRHLFARGWEEA